MRSRWGIALMIFCMLFCLSGCGESGEITESAVNSISESEGGSGIEGEEVAIDRSDLDWRESGWKRGDATGEGKTLYVEEYVEGLQYDPDFAYEKRYGITLSYKSIICRMEYFILEDDETRYYMNRYDGDTGEITHTELDIDSLLGGESEAGISDFDILDEEEYVFLRVTYEEGHDFSPGWKEEDDKVCGMTAVHTDAEGNIIKTVDLYSGVVGSDYLQDIGWCQEQKLKMDLQGNYYIYSSQHGDKPRKMAVLDCEGRELCVIEPYPKGTQGEAEWGAIGLKYLMKSPDGSPVFGLPHPGRSETLLFMYDQQQNAMKQLLLMPVCDWLLMRFCMTDDGMCYYLSNDGSLYQWDLCTGGILRLMNCTAADITTNVGYLRLAMNSEGKLLISETDDDGYHDVYVLTAEEPSTENNMRVASLTSDCRELQACAADYTRKHRENGITVEYASENPEAYRDRLMADLVAGKGPEAMYVSREDMETLYEKGLLADLTDVLSPETAEQIFPGVLECGRIDGRQIGFAVKAELQTMLVDRNVWDADSWSLEDVLALLEEEELCSGLEAIVATGVAPFSARGIFQRLVLWNMAYNPFLDLENHTCSFDSEEFIQLMELCKQYGKLSVGSDAVTMIQEGKALAYVDDFGMLTDFCDRLGSLGANYQCVGFPTESGSGNFWECDYFLVVRKDAGCMDTVKGYVDYLYSLRRQRKQNIPLHREVYNRYVMIDDDYYPEYLSLSLGQGYYLALKQKPDGSSCVDDFLYLAENSVPRPHSDDSIAQIVMEEADSFFSGDKDAATVAGIIQNRIKLYLQENS
ncbi:MAG: ABC transporter substrate-binding protein [bacterium]|nr:ABC transporter substrate-binding protein [bacterium]